MLPLSERNIKNQCLVLNEILIFLQNEEKVIEDDTIADRVVTLFESLISFPIPVEEVFGRKQSKFILCEKLISKCGQYSDSTCSFALKLFSTFSSDKILSDLTSRSEDTWRDCLETILKVDLDSISVSLQYAWLSAVRSLLCGALSFEALIDLGLHYQSIINLFQSISMFVEKQAQKVIAKLILALNSKLKALDKKSEMFKKCYKNLAAIMDTLKKGLSLEFLLKILTICGDINATVTIILFNEYFNESGNFFESKGTRKKLILMSRVGCPALVSFIKTFCSDRDHFDCKKFIPLGLAHELVMVALLNNPLHTSSYDMLSAVAESTNKASYFEMMMLVFDVAFGRNLSLLSFLNDDGHLWKAVLDDTLTSRSRITALLTNTIEVCQNLWLTGLPLELQTKMIKYFDELLKAIYELEDTPEGLKPEILQNFKLATSVMNALKNCNINVSCWRCFNDTFPATLQSVMLHANADYQVLKTSGCLILSMTRPTDCQLHRSDLPTVTSLCDCLVTKMSHLRWEDRDSAFEVLSLMLEQLEYHSCDTRQAIEQVLRELNILEAVLLSLSDDNEYIQASALLACLHLVENTGLFTPLKLRKLLSKTINIIQSESSACARRAAVNTLSACLFQSGELLDNFLKQFPVYEAQDLSSLDDEQQSDAAILVNQSLSAILCLIPNDFDAEVKCNGIKILERIHKHVSNPELFVGDPDKMISKICLLLRSLALDYDVISCEKAAKLLHLMTPTNSVTELCKDEHPLLCAELNSLLNEMHFRLSSKKSYSTKDSTDVNQDPVVIDCY
ncbi:uncharacterized protein LOC143445816 [Clavelina lepadiformis]|uniref:uncharacterized protein LOC143445816 n=1 Tax=Clavelina lepadiformis TaxID=159417 RepID=UPI004041D12B